MNKKNKIENKQFFKISVLTSTKNLLIGGFNCGQSRKLYFM